MRGGAPRHPAEQSSAAPSPADVEGQILRGSLQQKRKDEGPKDSLTFEEAVVAAIDFHGALSGTGSYAPPPEARGGKHKGAGVGPSPAYSYSAQVAEVSVDEDTGEVTVHKVWAAHDCGRALNPVSVEGQVIGSVWMGMGQALTEEMIWKDGLLMNPGLLEYRSPSSVESPEVEAIIVESIDPEGPFGAKEASEGSLAATIPAIANAIYDAVGIRLHESPFTPERVLAALRAKRNAKPLNLTEGVDPTAPTKFREHGGWLCFKGKGPERHEYRIDSDPASTGAAGRCGLSLPEFKLLRPRTTAEAIALLAQHAGNIRILAGGTDLLPSMQQKLFEPQYVLDIRRIAELKGIRPQPDGGVEIGALTALTDHRALRSSCVSTFPCFPKRRKPSLRPCCATWAQSEGTSVSTRAASGTTSRCSGENPAPSALRKMAISATSRRAARSAGRFFRATLRRRCSALTRKSRWPAPPACAA